MLRFEHLTTEQLFFHANTLLDEFDKFVDYEAKTGIRVKERDALEIEKREAVEEINRRAEIEAKRRRTTRTQ